MENDDRELREKQIISLITAYYNKFEFLQSYNLDDLIKKGLDRYLDSDLDIDEINEELMKIILDRKKTIDNRFNEDKVIDNHKELYETLDKITIMLNNANIDYQIAGALCAYLKYNEESKRVHDDIDLNMNEDDLEKFMLICQRLGFNYSDRRMNSPRILENGIPHGEHEVIVEIPESDLHIGVFPFKRNKDGSIDNRSYYKDENGETMVWNEHISPSLAKLVFGKEKVEYNGHEIIITPPEYVYSLKSYTRKNKDLYDLRFMDGKIDMDKLSEISSLNRTDRRVDLIGVEDSFHDEKDELSTMLEPEEKKVENKLEKPKVFTKKDNTKLNESGFIHYRQIVVPFIVLVIMVVLIEIFNFIS